MEAFNALLLEEGGIAETLLSSLTFDDLCSLTQCGSCLARVLTGNRSWLHAAVADVRFLQLESPCFQAKERCRAVGAVRVLRRAVPARGLKVPLDSTDRVVELARAVASASRASALHMRDGGGFAVPVVAILRWQSEAALLDTLSLESEEEFCVSAPISLPPKESERLAGALGLSAGCRGPARPIRVFFAWREGRLMVAMVEGGLLAERLDLPATFARPLTSSVPTCVRVTVRCLCPDLPLPEIPLDIPLGMQWVAVPMALPKDADDRRAAVKAMLCGALCVLTVTDCESRRQMSWINILGLQPLSAQ